MNIIENLSLLRFNLNYELFIYKEIKNPNINQEYFEKNNFYNHFKLDKNVKEFILSDDYYFINQDKELIYSSNFKKDYENNDGYYNIFKLDDGKGKNYFIISILYYDEKYSDNYNKGSKYDDEFLNISKKWSKIKYPKVILFFFNCLINIELIEYLCNFYKNYLKNKSKEFILIKKLFKIKKENSKIIINDCIKIFINFNFFEYNDKNNFDNNFIFMIIFNLLVEKKVLIFYDDILKFINLCNIIFFIMQPIKYVNLFIPNLNPNNIFHINNIFPYFIGVNSKYNDNLTVKVKDKLILEMTGYNINIKYKEEDILDLNNYDLKQNNLFNLKILFFKILFDFIKNIIFYFKNKNKNEINFEFFTINDCFDLKNFIKNNKNFFNNELTKNYFLLLCESALFYNLIENMFIYLNIRYYNINYNFNDDLYFKYLDIFVKGYLKCYLLVKNKSINYIFEYNFDDIFYFTNLIKYFKSELKKITYNKINILYNNNDSFYEKVSTISTISESIINKIPLYDKLNQLYNNENELNNFKKEKENEKEFKNKKIIINNLEESKNLENNSEKENKNEIFEIDINDF